MNIYLKGYVSIRFNEDGSLVTLIRDASGLITGSDLGKLAPDGRSGQFSAYMTLFPSLRFLMTQNGTRWRKMTSLCM